MQGDEDGSKGQACQKETVLTKIFAFEMTGVKGRKFMNERRTKLSIP
jgi:hypothetical protein